VTDAISVSVPAGPSAPADAHALIDSLPVPLATGERDDLRRALTELVTSAEARIDLQVSMGDGAIRCELTGAPRATWNCAVLDQIATRWGTLMDGGGVWFELDRAPGQRSER
jgi:hypothetical protein